eukprot:m.37055 g.37055  ORF g.37055 m.37055 type:complete len:315 (-) comp5470_c0_seq2:189-1133(-)
MPSSHDYADRPENANILIGMRVHPDPEFKLVPRSEAKVSIFDSGFMLGDGVWEGIRLHNGVLFDIEAHMDRCFEGAKALMMDLAITPEQLIKEIYKCTDANKQKDHVHIRLMITRGLKPTPYQAPKTTIGIPTIVIVPEIKESSESTKEVGIKLMTVSTRRGRPDVQDPAWNSHSKLNCISACIQGQMAGADEALMLDPHGFVATCNSTHFFIVRKGEIWTSQPKHILHGITRQNVIDLARENGIVVKELDFSLTKVYSADEAFVTGTMAGQIPVTSIDGRVIGTGKRGPMVERLQKIYKEFFLAKTAKRAEGF